MKLSTYIVGQGDTIELLAQILLGSKDKATTLAKLNSLRYPYISDDPAEQFGNRKGSILLIGSYVNPSTVTINNVNSLIINQNDTIIFSEGVNFGSGVVQSISGSQITFTAPIIGTYDNAAMITVYSDQLNVSTQVLRTGDTLFYPAINSSGSNKLIIGTDWKLDERGYLTRDSQDIATVTGFDNLKQSIRKRLQTPIGSLKSVPNYGNKLFNIIGESSALYFSALARHFCVDCVLQDPLIQSAEVSDLSINEDKVFIQVIMIPVGSQDPIVQPIAINIGGVS